MLSFSLSLSPSGLGWSAEFDISFLSSRNQTILIESDSTRGVHNNNMKFPSKTVPRKVLLNMKCEILLEFAYQPYTHELYNA